MDAHIQLWPHQRQAIREFADHVRAGRKRVVVSLPTGGGKTIVAAELSRMCARQGKQVVFAAPKIVLVDQTIAAFSKRFGLPTYEFGILQADNTRKLDAPYIVATPQTIRTRGLPPGVRLVVVDEAHNQHKALHAALDELPDLPTVLGLTATPYSRGMAEHWDALVCTATTDALCQSGELVPAKAYAAKFLIDTADLDFNTRTGDYGTAADIEERTTSRVLEAASQRWAETCQREFGELVPTIAFARSIEQGGLLVDEFKRKGHDFRHIHSGDNAEERNKHIADFRSGKCLGLVSVAVLAEGFDVRDVRCVLNVRPSKSLTRLVQIIGRGQRSCPETGKTKCVYIDCTNSFADTHMDIYSHWADGPATLRPEGKKAGTPPMKTCPECGALVALGTKECPECGYTWPENDLDTERGLLVEFKRGAAEKMSYEELVETLRDEIRKRGRGFAWGLAASVAERKAQERGYENPYHIACGIWRTFESEGLLDGIYGSKWHSKTIPAKRPGSAWVDMAAVFDQRAWTRAINEREAA